MDDVVDDDGPTILGDLQAPHVRLAGVDARLGGIVVKAAARVGLTLGAVLHGLAAGGELFGRAEAGIGVAGLLQLLERSCVGVEALRLQVRAVRAADLRALVPVEAEPAHGPDDEVDVFLGGALGVGILDAQDELAAHGAGKRPVVDGSAGTADMQLARRRRGKANTNFRHGWSP